MWDAAKDTAGTRDYYDNIPQAAAAAIIASSSLVWGLRAVITMGRDLH